MQVLHLEKIEITDTNTYECGFRLQRILFSYVHIKYTISDMINLLEFQVSNISWFSRERFFPTTFHRIQAFCCTQTKRNSNYFLSTLSISVHLYAKHVDDVLSISNVSIENRLGHIYNIVLENKDTTDNNTSASDLNLFQLIRMDSLLFLPYATEFPYHNFPFVKSSVPNTHSSFISKLIWYTRA